MITIDSRGCGLGKTTTNIYPQIDYNLLQGQRTLVVVAGIELQRAYKKQFPQAAIINSQDRDASVVDQTVQAMTNGQQLVIITAECFKRLHLSTAIKSTWNLIIDEAFDPYRTFRYIRHGSRFDWSAMLNYTGRLDGRYAQVEVLEDHLDNWTLANPIIQELMAPNWTTWVDIDTVTALAANDTRGRVEIFQELSADIMRDWATTLVAAAAFERTFMSYWLRRNNIATATTHAFTHQELPARLHTIEGFTWSKTRQNTGSDDQYVAEYRDYVRCDLVTKQRQLLALRNVGNQQIISDSDRLLSHNPHGLNHLTQYLAVSLESALNPSKEYHCYLNEFVGMEAQEIRQAFTGYLFYQALMRTALRVRDNTQVVDVYVLDERNAQALVEFMGFSEHTHIPSTYTKSTPIPKAELMRQLRQRRSEPVTKIIKQLYENSNTTTDGFASANAIPTAKAVSVPEIQTSALMRLFDKIKSDVKTPIQKGSNKKKPTKIDFDRIWQQHGHHRNCSLVIKPSQKNSKYIGLYCADHGTWFAWLNPAQVEHGASLGIDVL